jgi:hypothetical protein
MGYARFRVRINQSINQSLLGAGSSTICSDLYAEISALRTGCSVREEVNQFAK